MKEITVAEVIRRMNKIADPGLAYDWDNSGLQVGDPSKIVRRILLALDVTENCLRKAVNEQIDLIISHHPLIFKSISRITDKKLLDLIKNDISVYSAHTSLDVSGQGVNHALAELLQLSDIEFISSETGSELFQVAVFLPSEAVSRVKESVFAAGAGMIGNYRDCCNEYQVKGQFIPLQGSQPAAGKIGNLENVDETKLEFFVDSFNLKKAIAAMLLAHPYETPSYAVYPQNKRSETYGLGIIGSLPEERTMIKFAHELKKILKTPLIKLWPGSKSSESIIRRVAVCGGSGSSLIADVVGRADVFISGDFTYHTVLESALALIDAGHFYTEQPVLEKLRTTLNDLGPELVIFPAEEHEISNEIYI